MAKAPTTSEFSIRSGVIVNPDRIILLAGRDELDSSSIANTFIFGWRGKGQWIGDVKNWGAGSICTSTVPLEQIVVLGENRQILAWGLDGDEVEGSFADQGIGSSVTSIRGRPYIVGMEGLIYRRTSRNEWEQLDVGISHDADLEAIAGSSEEEMYAVGWNGEIYWLRQLTGVRVNSPTNVILTSVCMGGNGFVYCCGRNGVVLCGLEEHWEVVEHGSTTEDLWSVEWFQGKLYVASASFLYRLEPEGLVRVSFAPEVALTAYHLSKFDDSHLLSIGRRDVMLFDGKSWMRIL